MSRNRWKQVSELFQQALERSPNERNGFLREVCDGDTELFEDVKQLLDADSEAGGFMETPLVHREDTEDQLK